MDLYVLANINSKISESQLEEAHVSTQACHEQKEWANDDMTGEELDPEQVKQDGRQRSSIASNDK